MVGRSLPSGVGLPEDIEFIGVPTYMNFKVIQYFVTIVGCIVSDWNFISKFIVWLVNNVVFLPKRLGKDHFL